MKKNIKNIYPIIFSVIVFGIIFAGLRYLRTNRETTIIHSINDVMYFEQSNDFQRTECAEDCKEEKWANNGEPTVEVLVNVTPIHTPDNPILLSKAEKGMLRQPVKVEMQKVRLYIPESEASKIKTQIFCSRIPTVLEGLLYGWITIVVIVFNRKIKKGTMFTEAMSKCFDWSGLILMCVYFLEAFLSHFTDAISEVAMAYYDIHFVGRPTPMLMAIALIMMALSRIILKSKEMKEEQDLTI